MNEESKDKLRVIGIITGIALGVIILGTRGSCQLPPSFPQPSHEPSITRDYAETGDYAGGTRITRAQLKKMLIGETQAEVLKVLGKPDDNMDYGSYEVWSYRHATMTYDPITEKQDSYIGVTFTHEQRVDSVFF